MDCSSVLSSDGGAAHKLCERPSLRMLTGRGLPAAVDSDEGIPTRAGGGYLMSVSILNIGRYMAITIVPTMKPTPIIRMGSMIEVSDWMLASTSSS